MIGMDAIPGSPEPANVQAPVKNTSYSSQQQGQQQRGTWNPQANAKWVWYLAGIIPLGSIAAIIYVLMSDSKKRIFSILFILGMIGPLLVWLVVDGDDRHLSDIGKKIFIGQIISLLVTVVAVAGLSLSFLMGAFNGGSALLTGCIANPGFMCSGPQLIAPIGKVGGGLSVTIGQNKGMSMYNVELACTSLGLSGPIPAGAFESLGMLGLNTTLTSGQMITINLPYLLQCYNASGYPLSQTQISTGTKFSGSILINYTQNAGPVSPSNHWFTEKVAAITAT